MHPTQTLDLFAIPDRDLTEPEALALTEQYETAEQAQGYIVHLLAKGNGYKALGYATIEEWGAERFLLSRSQMERLIVHGRVIAILICRPVGDIGTRYPNERQARVLAGLLDEPAELCRAWDLAVADGTSRVTATLVASAVAQIRPALAKPPKEPKAPKQPTADELELARLRKMEAEEMTRRSDEAASKVDGEKNLSDSTDTIQTGDKKPAAEQVEEVEVRAQTTAEQIDAATYDLVTIGQRLDAFRPDMTRPQQRAITKTLTELLDSYAPAALAKNIPTTRSTHVTPVPKAGKK